MRGRRPCCQLKTCGELRPTEASPSKFRHWQRISPEHEPASGAEEGLALFVQRYSPTVPEAAIDHIVKALGYFGDVPDDLELPVPRETIERYWVRRQPEIVKSIDDLGGNE